MYKTKSVLIFLFCLKFNLIKTIDKNIVTVETNNGLIIGKIENPIDGKQLNVFRGIPYAKPPIGDLRFKKPVPVEKWEKPINAFKLQSLCVQDVNLLATDDNHSKNKKISEDCLYLNVWSPVNNKNENKPKAVMVWIHGGGLLVNAPDREFYQGDILAAKGDVVVVSMEYRLNIFGFLYTGNGDAPGNVGLWDQALALEWVNDNIKYFGGDPNQVTIAGESAGSWSVSLHIISPVSRHLFKNAILNSGAYVYKFIEDKPEDHIKRWLRGVEMIGCSDTQSDGKFTQKIMECLRDTELLKLVKVSDIRQLIPGSVKAIDLIVVDGMFLPEAPNKMLKKGDFKQDVNIMISTVEDEGDFLVRYFNDPEKFHPIHPMNLSYTEAYNNLHDISSGLNSKLPINGEDVAKFYYSGLSDSSGFDLLRRTIGIAVGDYYLTCPTLLFAEEVFKKSQYRSNVYQYYFNSKFQDNLFCSHWMGVCHTNDIFPMFGIPFMDSDNYNDREREISEQMIEFLTDFAKTGTPTSQNGTVWPKYFKINKQIIDPYLEITNTKNTTEFKTGRKLNECKHLWKKYLL